MTHLKQLANYSILQLIVFTLIAILEVQAKLAFTGCLVRYTNQSDPSYQVCVCNSTFCHTIEPPGKLSKGKALLYQTTKHGERLSRVEIRGIARSKVKSPGALEITVDPSITYQSIIGFGGAMTDATSININLMKDEALKQEIMQSYFGDDGIEYNMIRVPMASCDFSTHEYSYLDRENDFDLATFHLAEEDLWKIGYIKKAKKMARKEIKIFGSPWSAPAWMKTNGHMKGGGKLKPGPKYMRTWAKYFVRFIEDYFYQGVPIWGVTIQNEPSTGADPDYTFQTMYMPPKAQSDFISGFLGEHLRNSAVANSTILMIHDDFRNNLPEWADQTFENPETDKLVAGIAVHWYGDEHTNASKLSETKQKHPAKFILSTEACISGELEHPVLLGSFDRAERYARDIIEDLRHNVSGWVDWNMVLDLQGGPNWVKNFVDAPIIVNVTGNEFYKQPMYYVMGQFSKFIEPNAQVVEHVAEGDMADVTGIVTLVNPDSRRVVIVHNRSEKTFNITVSDVNSPTVYNFQMEPSSISTLLYI